MKKSILIIVILFTFSILIVSLVPGISGDYIKTSKLYINEIMASNSYTIKDKDGDYSDYIELYNGYNYDIDLEGYCLSDNQFEVNKWCFPSIKIPSRGYLLVFASGKDVCILDECHTNFKLSSKGEETILMDKTGNVISKIKYDAIENDISYGYYRGRYLYFDRPTPKEENNGSEFKRKNNTYHLKINEYMTHNKSYNYDSNGYYYDWVELYNEDDREVVLSNVYLSDDSGKLNKYKLPEVKIEAGGYLIVYLSDTAKYENGEVYADFKLSDNEEIVISAGRKVIDKVKVVTLPQNISYGFNDGEWYYYTAPTPGYENDTAGFKTLGGSYGDT